MTTTTESKTELTLFIHLPGPGKTLLHYDRKVSVPASRAEEVVRAFWGTDFSEVWELFDHEVQRWITTLTAPYGDAWSSSPHKDDVARFAPDLS